MNERPSRTEREQRLTKTYKKIMEEDLNKQGVAEPEEVDNPIHGIDWTAIIDSIVEHDGPVRIPEPFTEPFLNDLLEAAVDYACQAKDNNHQITAKEYRRERALSVAINELKRLARPGDQTDQQLTIMKALTQRDAVIQNMIGALPEGGPGEVNIPEWHRNGYKPRIPDEAKEPIRATEHNHSTSGSQREAEAEYDAWGFGKPFIRPLPRPKLTVDGPLMDFIKGIVGELAPPPAGIGTQGSAGYFIGVLKESLDQLRFAAQATITSDIVKEKAYKIGAAAYLLTVAAEPKKGVNQ